MTISKMNRTISKTPFGKIMLKCSSKIAYDSPDHIVPEGTRKDNSKNPKFNDKLFRLYGQENQLKILNLGCAGGGFVRSCIDDGQIAMGLEGSDYSQKFKRAEWRIIPEYLFTCDITKEFNLYQDKNPFKFDAITCWEVMEHIKQSDLPKLCSNIKKHLATNGIWIMSISVVESSSHGVQLHQTVKPISWWRRELAQQGFVIRDDILKFFNKQFIRGESLKHKGSYNLVVTLPKNKPPKVPFVSWKLRLWESWTRSSLHKWIKMIITGDII
ncbi:MAG: methyltransferase domain-containing protein [archaeon]